MSEHGYVWISPGRKSGQPCIGGTRIPTEMAADRCIYDGIAGALGSWPDLRREDFLVACWWEATRPRAAKRFRHWKQWATNSFDALWSGDYDKVPDPPEVSP